MVEVPEEGDGQLRDEREDSWLRAVSEENSWSMDMSEGNS